MKTSTIAEAKNNLSQLIYQLESDEPIHLTRHGKPVAVMLSEVNYQKLTHKDSHQCPHIPPYPGTNRAMSARIRSNKDIPVIIAF